MPCLKPIDRKKFQAKKGSQASRMQTVGRLLGQVVQDNPKSFRIFSPDKLKLNEVFKHTGRKFQSDQYSNAQGGRVVETLSEHQCQGIYGALS